MLASAMALPKFIFVKSISNSKYLCYTKEDGPSHARLRFSFDEKDEKPEFRCVKFEVEESTLEGMVHIKNCYNNKYLVRKSADSNLIVGEANEPEEDQSKWSCTLFKPVFLDSAEEDVESAPHLPDKPRKIQLLHIDQLGQQHTTISNTRGDADVDLIVGDEDAARSSGDGDVFIVYDARSAVVLPKHIAVMGYTDEYCALSPSLGTVAMQFNTKDIGAQGVLHTTHNSGMNLVIRNEQNKLYWRVSYSLIVAGLSSIHNQEGHFQAIRLVGNEIALRCESTNTFAQCGDAPPTHIYKNLLLSDAKSITQSARLRIFEPVLRREVKDFKYNMNDARLYNVREVRMYTDSRSNYGTVEQSGSFSVSYTKAQTMSWNDSVSITTGLSASMTFAIPYMGDLGFEYSREETETREWGKETTTEEKVEYGQNVTIPPRKKKTITVVAMEASYDIPFTCEVIDTLTNGQVSRYTMTDGLFVGANGYKYDTKIIDEEL